MARKQTPYDELTISEPLSVTLKDGTTARGTLWMHPSRRGGFEVECGWGRKSDGRAHYQHVGHIGAIARIILREMAENAQ